MLTTNNIHQCIARGRRNKTANTITSSIITKASITVSDSSVESSLLLTIQTGHICRQDIKLCSSQPALQQHCGPPGLLPAHTVAGSFDGKDPNLECVEL